MISKAIFLKGLNVGGRIRNLGRFYRPWREICAVIFGEAGKFFEFMICQAIDLKFSEMDPQLIRWDKTYLFLLLQSECIGFFLQFDNLQCRYSGCRLLADGCQAPIQKMI